MEINNCGKCGEDAICVEINSGACFVRVRRVTKCKNEFCKTTVKINKEDAVMEWNENFGEAADGQKEKITVQVEFRTVRQYELDSIDDLKAAIKNDGMSGYDYEVL